MKKIFFSLLLIGSVSFAGATKSHMFSGTYVGTSGKYFELKDDHSTLLIPKEFLPKKSYKVGDKVDVTLTEAQLSEVNFKK